MTESYKQKKSSLSWRQPRVKKDSRFKKITRQALQEAGITRQSLNNPLPYRPVTGELVEVSKPPEVNYEAKTSGVDTKNVKKKVQHLKFRGLTGTEGLILGGLGTLAVGNIIYKNLKNRKK